MADSAERNQQQEYPTRMQPGIVTTIPDPTSLTTAQLYREIAVLSTIFDAKMSALSARVDASESASKEAVAAAEQSLQRGLDKSEHQIVVSIEKVQSEQRNALTAVEGRMDEKIATLRGGFQQSFDQHRIVDDEKFHSIEVQFTERDKRTEQLSLADKTAIAAALQAQKEAAGATNESNAAAISKSEVGFTKQIDQIYTLVASMAKSLDDKINDLKGRLDRGEGTGKGRQDMWGWVVAGIALLISLFVALRGRL